MRMHEFKQYFDNARNRSLLLLALGIALYVLARLALFVHDAFPRTTLPASGAVLRIGSKNFTESLIVAEIYAQTLEKAGYRVQRKFNLGGTLIAHGALRRGEIDVYPEYTGTGLLDVLRLPAPRTPDESVIGLLDAEYRRRWRLRWLAPAQANDSQSLAVIRETAQRLHLNNLSRLSLLAPSLSLGSIAEFEERSDGLPGLRQSYGGFQFKTVRLIDNGLKYQALLHGDVDIVVAFTTDGALLDPRFVLLDDDRHFWPDYRIAPVVREESLRRFSKLETVLNRTSALLTTRRIQQLNGRVDRQKRDYRAVVRNFIHQDGAL